MFSLANNLKTIQSFLIPAALLFNKNHQHNINVYDYTQKVIGVKGDALIINHDDNVIVKQSIPKKALIEDKLIDMEIISDGSSWVYLFFQPHGLVFKKPAKLNIYLDGIKDLNEQDLILYYYDETREEWIQETNGVFSKKREEVMFHIHHFSYYYCSVK